MWWGHAHGFGLFPFVCFPFIFFMVIVLGCIVVRLVLFRRLRRFGGCCCGPVYGMRNQDSDPEVILKRRLANGDITAEEYKHLQDMLKK